MGKIYSSTAKKLPREIRRNFETYLEHEIYRPFEFHAIEQKAFDPENEMIVEGIANLAEPDRWGEIIVPEAWNLELFKKNPIMLYEHWRENAVGTAIEVKVKKDGLYYKARVGDPKKAPLTPTQIHVRSLLAQGILRTNSVGFIPHVIEYNEDEDQLRYTDVELLEISFVAIPMQQDSVITSVKSWRSKNMAGKSTTTTETDDDVTKAIADNTAALKSVQTEVAKLSTASDTEIKALKAQVVELTAKNAALVAEGAKVETNTKALLESLQKQGVLKAPAAAAAAAAV